MKKKQAPKRILIVEDSMEVVDVLKVAFQKKRYHVSVAVNGQEALEAVQRDPPDLMVLDLMLPEMNGVLVREALQNDPLTKNIPILVLTGAGAWGRTHISPQDVAAYLEKPFSIIEVMQTVDRILSSSR